MKTITSTTFTSYGTPIKFSDTRVGDRIRAHLASGSVFEDTIKQIYGDWADGLNFTCYDSPDSTFYLLDRPVDQEERAKKARLAYWDALGEPRHTEPKAASLEAWVKALEAADDPDASTRPTPKPKAEPRCAQCHQQGRHKMDCTQRGSERSDRVKVGDRIRMIRLSEDGWYDDCIKVGTEGVVEEVEGTPHWAIESVNFGDIGNWGYDLVLSIRPGDFEIVEPEGLVNIRAGSRVRVNEKGVGVVPGLKLGMEGIVERKEPGYAKINFGHRGDDNFGQLVAPLRLDEFYVIPLKVGDRIRITSMSWLYDRRVKVGQLATVESVGSGDYLTARIEFGDGLTALHVIHPDDFEPLIWRKASRDALKVGDRVRLTVGVPYFAEVIEGELHKKDGNGSIHIKTDHGVAGPYHEAFDAEFKRTWEVLA